MNDTTDRRDGVGLAHPTVVPDEPADADDRERRADPSRGQGRPRDG